MSECGLSCFVWDTTFRGCFLRHRQEHTRCLLIRNSERSEVLVLNCTTFLNYSKFCLTAFNSLPEFPTRSCKPAFKGVIHNKASKFTPLQVQINFDNLNWSVCSTCLLNTLRNLFVTTLSAGLLPVNAPKRFWITFLHGVTCGIPGAQGGTMTWIQP